MNRPLIIFGMIAMIIGLGIQLLLVATAHGQPEFKFLTPMNVTTNENTTNALLKTIISQQKLQIDLQQLNEDNEAHKLIILDSDLHKLIAIISHTNYNYSGSTYP